MSKFNLNKANHLESSLGRSKYEGYGGNAGGYSVRDTKNAGRYTAMTDRTKYN